MKPHKNPPHSARDCNNNNNYNNMIEFSDWRCAWRNFHPMQRHAIENLKAFFSHPTNGGRNLKT
ncbi:hypothetical protein I7I48_07292 [Histoplasma ohiense]|nr:hypothetical protein I7I48_07292 [Histoplasma ohiense (nom. inval.)]